MPQLDESVLAQMQTEEQTFQIWRRKGTEYETHYTVRIFTFPAASVVGMDITAMGTAFHVDRDGEGDRDIGAIYASSAAEAAAEIGFRCGEDFESIVRRIDHDRDEQRRAQERAARAKRAAHRSKER